MYATYIVHGGRERGREREIEVGRERLGDRRIKGERREIHSECMEGGRDGRMEGVHTRIRTHTCTQSRAHAHAYAHAHTREQKHTHTPTCIFVQPNLKCTMLY